MVIALLYLLYVALGLRGVFILRVNNTNHKLVMDHSPYKAWFPILEHYVWGDYFEITLNHNKVPDLRNVSNYQQAIDIVEKMEALNRSAGPASTIFWLREYQQVFRLSTLTTLSHYHQSLAPAGLGFQWLRTSSSTGRLDAKFLRSLDAAQFLGTEDAVPRQPPVQLLHQLHSQSLRHHIRSLLRFQLPTNGCIREDVEGYRVQLSYLGARTWDERRKVIEGARAIADSHPDFSVSIFSSLSPYVDMNSILVGQQFWAEEERRDG